MVDLNIAEIYYTNGNIKFRYSRYMSEDGTKWVRHGLFEAYHESGSLASSGNYEHDSEDGLWCDYHENGQIAAEGHFEKGQEVGNWNYWNYWNCDGSKEQ